MTGYVVAGVARSGTSMMVRSLWKGGIPAVFNTEVYEGDLGPEHRKPRQGLADKAYHINPRGCYEMRGLQTRSPHFIETVDGKVIKRLDEESLRLPEHDWKVILMRRDPAEVRQSNGGQLSARRSDEEMTEYVNSLQERLENRSDMEVTVVWYDTNFITDPLPTYQTLQFKGFPIDPIMAASVVEPELYRNHVST